MKIENKCSIYGKYILSKADGSLIDPKACYFVLRLDTDEAARRAAITYAENCENEKLSNDIFACVAELRKHRLLGDVSVWRHGGRR